MPETINLLGVKISRVTPTLAYQQILQWVKEARRSYVCVAPVATLVDAKHDASYASVINAAGMVTPDGMPVVWLARLKGAREIERTYGPDLMRALCGVKGQGLRHFLYGATASTLEHLQQRLKEANPSVLIAGAYAPAFKEKAEIESAEVLAMINNAKADILWVALGSPKQDFWMALNRPLLNASVLIGIGAAFDFISGVKPQAPSWMGRVGLEWLFRFCCEPRRLWKRYLVNNTLFIFYCIKDFLKGKK